MRKLGTIGIRGLLLSTIVLASLLPTAVSWAKSAPLDPVETRIGALRGKFHITAAQESLWNGVAQAMRENAKAMAELRKPRDEHAAALSAVDELKGYATAIDVHAAGLRNFIPVFQSLYESMSDAKKKTADAEFRGDARAEAQRSKR